MSGVDFASDTVSIVHRDRKVEVAPNWATVYFQKGHPKQRVRTPWTPSLDPPLDAANTFDLGWGMGRKYPNSLAGNEFGAFKVSQYTSAPAVPTRQKVTPQPERSLSFSLSLPPPLPLSVCACYCSSQDVSSSSVFPALSWKPDKIERDRSHLTTRSTYR